MTYELDGQQYLLVAAKDAWFAFTLPSSLLCRTEGNERWPFQESLAAAQWHCWLRPLCRSTPRQAVSQTQPASWLGKKKLLAIADPQEWYGHVNYHHDSASHTLATVERLGRESGAWITVIRTDMELLRKSKLLGTNARSLNDFDGIFYMGEGPWDITDEQKANLLSFVHDDGKGFVAGHAGNGGHLLLWPEYAEMIGGNLVSEFPTTDLPVILEDPKFPGVDGFERTFWYKDQFTVVGPNFSRDVDHVIMRLDASKLEEAKARQIANNGASIDRARRGFDERPPPGGPMAICQLSGRRNTARAGYGIRPSAMRKRASMTHACRRCI